MWWSPFREREESVLPLSETSRPCLLHLNFETDYLYPALSISLSYFPSDSAALFRSSEAGRPLVKHSQSHLIHLLFDPLVEFSLLLHLSYYLLHLYLIHLLLRDLSGLVGSVRGVIDSG